MSAFVFSRSFSNELLSRMILFIPYKKMLLDGGGVVFSVFALKNFGFKFCWPLRFRFFGFLASDFLGKIKQVRFISNCNVGFWIFN